MRSAVLVAVLASAACKTMKTVTLDEMALLGPECVWVTDSDQSVLLLWEPTLVRDTLVGYVGKHREKLSSDGVKQVRVKTAAPTRTALLVAGFAVGLTGFLVLVGGSGESAIPSSTTGPPGYCDIDPEQSICTGVPD
jgi:hypothetical protein